MLSGVKLLGDGWDAGAGGYQVDSFPPLWAEQNDGFRTWARDLWRSAIIAPGAPYLPLVGSPDRYDPLGPLDRPALPVNYVTSHRGFYVADLVPYDRAHNEANLDFEGPPTTSAHGTAAPRDPPAIPRSMPCVPGRPGTCWPRCSWRRGRRCCRATNSAAPSGATANAWCQDNELTWLDWENADHVLTSYVARLSQLRRAHPLLTHGATRSALAAPALTVPDSAFLDRHGKPGPGASAVAFQLFLNGRPMLADQWDAWR